MVQGRNPLHAKTGVLSYGLGHLKMLRRRISVGGELLERAEHKAERAWTTRKTVERTTVGYSW